MTKSNKEDSSCFKLFVNDLNSDFYIERAARLSNKDMVEMDEFQSNLQSCCTNTMASCMINNQG